MATATTAMRAKLGESLNSIHKLNRGPEQTTDQSSSRASTPSLEAFRSYTAGYAEVFQGRFLAAIPLLERATELDPNFARAYNFLAIASYNLGDMKRSSEYGRKAFALIDHASEYERQYIAGGYYYDGTGELDKAIDALRSGSRNYPRDSGFHIELSTVYMDLGQFEQALEEAREAARLQPRNEAPYRWQLSAYMRMDRLREAAELVKEARVQGFDGARLHWRFLEIAFIEGDKSAAEKEIQWYAGRPEEYLSFGLQAARADSLGQRRKARDLYRRASETALRRDLSGAAADFSASDALADALAGNCPIVRHLGHPPLASALCGDPARAERGAADPSRLFPHGTLWNAVRLPSIRAAIALELDHPAKAIELLAPAVPFGRAYTEVPYLRGLAFLRLRKGVEAAAEFQQILDHKGSNWGQYHSLSYLGLARGSALAGDTTKARKAYEEFFAVWKDADPDIPILIRARQDYAKLPSAKAVHADGS